MQRDLISVIIPVFNTSFYLKKCIYSILKQSYKNLEILLILDGKQEKEMKICNEILSKDTRIKVFIKEHSGVSDTRNYGIKISTGKFICFVDGDDWLPKEAILNLYEAIVNSATQLSIGSITTVSEYGERFFKAKNEILKLAEKEKLAENLFSLDNPLGYMAAKLYYKDIIIKNNILFDTSMECYEDTYFTCQYLKYCLSIIFLDKNVYYYNRFNTIAATRKYQENRNKWELKKISVQYMLCKELEDKKYIAESIEKQFYNMCRYYFNLAPTKNISYKKIEETQKIYFEFLVKERIIDTNLYEKNIEELINELTNIDNKNLFNYIKKIKFNIRRVWSFILKIYYFKVLTYFEKIN